LISPKKAVRPLTVGADTFRNIPVLIKIIGYADSPLRARFGERNTFWSKAGRTPTGWTAAAWTPSCAALLLATVSPRAANKAKATASGGTNFQDRDILFVPP
jgi:hypothetical protein